MPTSWSLFPDSVKAVGTYLQFQIAGPLPGEPFNAAQKLSYFVMVFMLAPFQILTGAVKMVKWVRAVEFVADYRQTGMGQGGWSEDHEFYANEAGI